MVSFFTKSQPSADASGSDGAQDPPNPQAQDGANPSPKANDKPLDVVFLQDTTGSQGPYIQSARKAIRDICDKISASGDLSKDLIRFGLIAFRDHPPQDTSYVTKSFGFTSDVEIMQKNLSSLIASGGGDGPEAQTAALAEALNLEWAENAVKMVILITDSPPHGIGETGDGFSESPDQNDPLDVARQMAERGITLFVIACEPGLSRYQNAVDFYTALVQITSGRMFPLLMADKLGDYIIGTAVETIETERLIGEFEQVIVNDVYGNDTPIEVVTENLQERLRERGAKINTMNIENVYNESAASRKNVSVWQASGDIKSARSKTQPLTQPRLQAQFMGRGGVSGDFAAYGGFGSGSRERERERMMPMGMGMGGMGMGAPPPAAPAYSIAPQAYSQAQAQRVVMQSVARNSTVTPTGYVSRESGKSVSSPLPPPS